MFNQSIVILSFFTMFFLTACGDNITITINNMGYLENNRTKETNETQELNTPAKESLNGIALYGANLKKIKGSRSYDIEKFDGTTSALTPLYFDFDIKDFNVRSEDKEIFIDGKPDSFSNMEYVVNSLGRLIASVNKKDIYSLERLSTEAIKSNRVEEYRSDIDIEGTAYNIQTKYLSNFFMLDKLLTTDTFDEINEFIIKYNSKIFMGDSFRGLLFAENNKLKESREGNISDAGRYEIKNLDNINVVMIYPKDSNYYYTDNSCYILNFSRIWQGKCYLKESDEEKIYYNKEVYDDLLLYLKEKFITINISI